MHEKQAVSLSEEGVVVPPDTSLECLGDSCKSRKERETCTRAKHHLHSTEPDYEEAGPIATGFRDLSILTVWLFECRHDEHHGRHEIHVPVPALEVMREVIEEEKKIRQLMASQRELNQIPKLISKADITLREKQGLQRRENALLHNKQQELEAVKRISIIPEQLITGAMLIASPKQAKSRILMGGEYALPGIITKQEIPRALEVVEAAYLVAQSRALQTEVDKVELAA